MKNRILITAKTMLVVFISLLVFSCDPEEATVESDPYGDYALYGDIIDESSLNAIPNIEVTMQGLSILADQNGYYQIRIEGSPFQQVYSVKYRDKDGSMNGNYESREIMVDFTDIEFVNSNGLLYYGQKMIELDVELLATDPE